MDDSPHVVIRLACCRNAQCEKGSDVCLCPDALRGVSQVTRAVICAHLPIGRLSEGSGNRCGERVTCLTAVLCYVSAKEGVYVAREVSKPVRC